MLTKKHNQIIVGWTLNYFVHFANLIEFNIIWSRNLHLGFSLQPAGLVSALEP